MNEDMKLIVDTKKEIKEKGSDTEKAIFSSLKKITNTSSNEYIGSATFSMVVDALQFETKIFSINVNSIITQEDGIFAKPEADL